MKKTTFATILLLIISIAVVGCAKSYETEMRRNAVKQSSEHNARQGMSELNKETK